MSGDFVAVATARICRKPRRAPNEVLATFSTTHAAAVVAISTVTARALAASQPIAARTTSGRVTLMVEVHFTRRKQTMR